jgi:lipoprotein-releasing system permease protein
MRSLPCMVLSVLCACKATPAPGPGSPPHAGSAGLGSDPWARGSGSAGSRDAVPSWAHDPPAVLRAKIVGVNAHVIVLKTVVEFAEYRDVLAAVEKTPGVTAAEPFIFMEVSVSSPSKQNVSLALKAVDPKRVGRVLDLAKNLKVGKIETLASEQPPSIILGDVLAQTLGVTVGDQVTVTPPTADGPQWKPMKLRVTGTFHVDFDEYDERLGYVSIASAQAMLGRGDNVMGVEATVADLDQSDKTAEVIERALGGPPYQVMDWYELNKQLFTALYGDRRP